jgi:membrane peptidoglycan carboxypeptidase
VDLSTVLSIVDENDREIARHEVRAKEVVPPAVADLLSDLLKSVVEEGTAKNLKALGYSKIAHGKTGTTSFSRDAWFAGFSEGLAVITWMGFDELPTEGTDPALKKEAMVPLTGSNSALLSWAEFFKAIKPSALATEEVTYDASLEHVEIDKSSGLRAKGSCPSELVREELFLPGTEPTGECTLH